MGYDEKSGAASHELATLLEILPPVEFCCVYGSSLHPNNADKKSSMIDYILGVSDPLRWHSDNLKANKNHYASWMAHLGGPRLITAVADNIGVKVHFNPYVSHNDRMFKYGVVGVGDLVQDILGWDPFYLGGRLQKPVDVLVDKADVIKLNRANLKAATCAALLLLPSKFTEEQLYAAICNLSYSGDVRMMFAEDRDKVRKIVRGQFGLFHEMYRPVLDELSGKDLLRFSSSDINLVQDCGSSATHSLVSNLPQAIQSSMGVDMGDKEVLLNDRKCGEDLMRSKEKTGELLQKILRRKVMISSSRQALAGLLSVGTVHGLRYLGSKMNKAWKSWF